MNLGLLVLTGAEIQPRSTRQRNKTPELIKPTALYCIFVFWWGFSCCSLHVPMIQNQFPSPGSDFVSSSATDYLGLLMGGQQLGFCTLACSDGDGMDFKDTRPWKEGWKWSILPVPDQPNTKHSGCKPRHLFKAEAQHCGRTDAAQLPMMSAGEDGVTGKKKKKESESEYFLLFFWRDLHHLGNPDKPFSQMPMGYLRTGVQLRLQTSVGSVSLLPVKRN